MSYSLCSTLLVCVLIPYVAQTFSLCPIPYVAQTVSLCPIPPHFVKFGNATSFFRIGINIKIVAFIALHSVEYTDLRRDTIFYCTYFV